LRGPQGTLFGRNATGGVINVITNKASPDAIGGYADAEFSNYKGAKINGALNLPLNDRMAIRFAGTTIQRGGTTTNVFNGSKLDNRDIFALRGSYRWLATDNTTVDFTASYMREDDNRMRYQKQSCTEGPLSPLLGCDPNGARSFGRVDARATFLANTSAQTFPLVTGNPATSAYGLVNLAGGPLYGDPQPQDLRQVAYDTNPKYDAEETIFIANIKHDFEKFSVKLNGGWGDSKISSIQDFDGGLGPVLTRPAVICAPTAFGGLPAVCNRTGGAAGPATFPVSAFDVGLRGTGSGLVGTINGLEQSRSNRYQAIDWSFGETKYHSAEMVINSDLDGRFNFLLGGNYLKSSGYANYAVATNGLDYFAMTAGTLSAVGAGIPNAATTGYSFYTPYFYNDTKGGFLKSYSAFGEIYFKITDQLKLTGGVRHNWDTKGVTDRGNLLESSSAANPLVRIVPFGTPSVRPLLDRNEDVACTTAITAPTYAADCGAEPNGGVNDYRVIESDFNATTGRAVLQWTPTDNVQVYASWTRGYKPGGFNPRTTSASVALEFAPEVIKAYEAGIKSSLMGGALNWNFTGFYYDYSGLQVSKIFANTSVNENIDATVWGLENEMVWRANDRLIFNLNASYLKTKIGAFSTFDPRNPTAGAANAELVSDLTNASKCVVTRNAGAPALIGSVFGGPFAGLNPLVASNYSVCSQLASNIGTINLATGGTRGYAVVSGINQSVQGNKLPGSPSFKVSGGVQYTMNFGNVEVTPRADAFYQNAFYADIFNTLKDKIDGYAYVNAQVKIQPQGARWYVRGFVQNLTGSDAITGTFNSGQSTGNFQNLFLLEPRRYGASVGLVF
ncbi:MAG: TonB-dependent receptor, partial [Parvularculaceae bacterium]|nr:TonB-dependent receptor [Parvularculaceae bacterium]